MGSVSGSCLEVSGTAQTSAPFSWQVTVNPVDVTSAKRTWTAPLYQGGDYVTAFTVVKNRRTVADLQTTWTGAERHRLTAGVNAERNHTTNSGFGAIDRGQRLLAVFAQDEFSPRDDVFLTAGVRNDDFDTFGRATTGRLTAAWLAPGRRWKLRASHGTAFLVKNADRFFLFSETGDLILAKLSEKRYEELSRFHVAPKSETNVTDGPFELIHWLVLVDK